MTLCGEPCCHAEGINLDSSAFRTPSSSTPHSPAGGDEVTTTTDVVWFCYWPSEVGDGTNSPQWVFHQCWCGQNVCSLGSRLVRSGYLCVCVLVLVKLCCGISLSGYLWFFPVLSGSLRFSLVLSGSLRFSPFLLPSAIRDGEMRRCCFFYVAAEHRNILALPANGSPLASSGGFRAANLKCHYITVTSPRPGSNQTIRIGCYPVPSSQLCFCCFSAFLLFFIIEKERESVSLGLTATRIKALSFVRGPKFLECLCLLGVFGV